MFSFIKKIESYIKHLYAMVLALSMHPQALLWLWVTSIVDSFIFPIPPLVMLIPMMLAKPKKSFVYSFATTAGSIIGGVIGYYIGYTFFESLVAPVLKFIGGEGKFLCLKNYYEIYGWWAVLIWGFLPVPYKIITLASGFFKMPLSEFIFASILGRSVRYFGIGALFYFFGEKAKHYINKHFTYVTIVLALLLLILAYLMHKFNPMNTICLELLRYFV